MNMVSEQGETGIGTRNLQVFSSGCPWNEDQIRSPQHILRCFKNDIIYMYSHSVNCHFLPISFKLGTIPSCNILDGWVSQYNEIIFTTNNLLRVFERCNNSFCLFIYKLGETPRPLCVQPPPRLKLCLRPCSPPTHPTPSTWLHGIYILLKRVP